MKSRIIYGKSRQRNTQRCLDEINYFLKQNQGENLVILVPDQFSSYYEHLLVENSYESGSFRAEVLTFKRLAYRVFGNSPKAREKYIDNSGKSMIMYSVIAEIEDELRTFSKSVAYPAFATEAVKTVRELKRYGIKPEQLKDCEEEKISGLLATKLQELSRLFEIYEEKLKKGGYSDADDDLYILAEQIRKSPEIVNSKYWIDGFDGFTPAELTVINALIEKTQAVTSIFCCDSLSLNSKTDIFTPVIKTAQDIIKIGEQLGILTDELNIIKENSFISELPGELEYLAEAYFNYEASKYTKSSEAITIYKANTIYEEVERCAVEIEEKVRKGEMRYGEISVVSGLYEEYRDYIDVVFSKYNIPVFLDEKREIAKHPVVSYLLALLDIYVEKFSYEAVFSFLKSPYCNLEPDEVFELENYILQWDIKGVGMWTENDWEFIRHNKNQEKKLEKVNKSRKKITDMLMPLFQKFKYGLTAGEFILEIYRFFEENGIYEKISMDAERAKEEKRLEYADELTQSWNILMDIFDQLNTISGNKKQTVETFKTYLEVALSQKKIGIIPPRTDMVFAGGVNKAAGNNISMLMVLGTNDPGFPVNQVSEGLLTDKDRNEAATIGVKLAEDTRTRIINSRIDVFNLLNLSKKYLYISYSKSAQDGSTRRRSGFIDRILSLFENKNEQSLGDKLPEDYILTPISGMTLSSAQINSNSNLYKWYLNNGYPIDFLPKQDTAKDLPFTVITQKLYGDVIESSPTAIERYVECPYKYFVQYSLEASQRALYEISPPDVGSMLHEMLKSLVYEHGEDISPDYDKCLQTAVKTFYDMNLSNIFTRNKRRQHLGNRIVLRAVNSFLILKKQIDAGAFKPVEFEAAFGRNKPISALSFDAGNAKIFLNGRIDRVDAAIINDDEFFRIIDYKSSSQKLKLFQIKEGLNIQLAAYMMAYMNHSGTKPAGMYYFAAEDKPIKSDYGITTEEIIKNKIVNGRMSGYTLKTNEIVKAMDDDFDKKSVIIPVLANKDDELTAYVMSEEDVEGICSSISNLIVEKTKAIYEGEYSVEPVYTKTYIACTYCDYKGICGFDERYPQCKYRYVEEIKDEDIDWGKDE